MGNPPQDDVNAFRDAVRAAYLAPPDDATEARHLSAMAEEVRGMRHEAVTARRRHGLKEAVGTRFRNAALTARLAALTLIAALATGGLATAGVISLPDSLPGAASDKAEDVHEAIDGSDPSAESCAFGQEVAEAASDGKSNPQDDACAEGGATTEDRGRSDDVDVQQNGATPEEGAGAAFGDSVSDRASGGEPSDGGGDFGESVSEEAQQLVPRPTPQLQGGADTGETQSQQGQELGEQGGETGESFSQGGRDIAESHGGGPPQD
jgi:hypothetical protein